MEWRWTMQHEEKMREQNGRETKHHPRSLALLFWAERLQFIITCDISYRLPLSRGEGWCCWGTLPATSAPRPHGRTWPHTPSRVWGRHPRPRCTASTERGAAHHPACLALTRAAAQRHNLCDTTRTCWRACSLALIPPDCRCTPPRLLDMPKKVTTSYQ